MRTMPVSRDPLQTYTFSMERKNIRVTLRWGRNPGAWTIDLAHEGVDLVRGRRVLMGTDILRAFNLGIGEIHVIATENDETDATLEDLGVRVILVHAGEGELDAAIP